MPQKEIILCRRKMNYIQQAKSRSTLHHESVSHHPHLHELEYPPPALVVIRSFFTGNTVLFEIFNKKKAYHSILCECRISKEGK